ncbi:hypothetical protein H4582DRAFT_1982365 [Lactarius indigo]|nr:hypothetical protein H4582DRAFT_1982365 [Lactarius indigo]
MEVPPLDNFHSTSQTVIESPGTPFISSDPAAPGSIIPFSTLKSSIPTPPLPSISLPVVFPLQHSQDLLVPSDRPNMSFSAASNPVLDNILPIDSHRSIVVTAVPVASSISASILDLRAAAEDNSSQKPDLRENKDALNPSSVNQTTQANTMPTLVTDFTTAIAGPSMWEPTTERIRDHPPHPSRDRYDIV